MVSSLIVFFRSTAAVPLKETDRALLHMETTQAPIVSHKPC